MFSIPDNPADCAAYEAEHCRAATRENCTHCRMILIEAMLSSPPELSADIKSELTNWLLSGDLDSADGFSVTFDFTLDGTSVATIKPYHLGA